MSFEFLKEVDIYKFLSIINHLPSAQSSQKKSVLCSSSDE